MRWHDWQVYGTITHKYVVGAPSSSLPLNDTFIEQFVKITRSRSSPTSYEMLVLHGLNLLLGLQHIQACHLTIINPQ